MNERKDVADFQRCKVLTFSYCAPSMCNGRNQNGLKATRIVIETSRGKPRTPQSPPTGENQNRQLRNHCCAFAASEQ